MKNASLQIASLGMPRLRRSARPAVAALLVGFSALACTSAPPLPPTASARIVSVPAGARITTKSGEVFTSPAVLPMRRGESLCLEVSMAGHAPRHVVVDAADEDPTLAALGACALLPLWTAGGKWEPVPVVDGRVLLELEPLAAGEPTPGAAAPSGR